MTVNGITEDEYRALCLKAFENLREDTTVTMDDVDSILTWCLPEFKEVADRTLRLRLDSAMTVIAVLVTRLGGTATITADDLMGRRPATRAEHHPDGSMTLRSSR